MVKTYKEYKEFNSYKENVLFKFVEEVLDECLFQDSPTEDIKVVALKVFEGDEDKVNNFLDKIPEIKKSLMIDLDFFIESDPACNSKEEVILAYPGFRAISFYRIAHELYKDGLFLQSRLISEKAHSKTGIDIHPGASIGSPFFIDHGTGIVIGETAIVGTNVKLYQGVTLGALSLSRGRLMKGTKRHPTIGNNVTIYAGASILGDIKVGNNVTIGSNVFLTDSVGENIKVIIGKPDLIVMNK